MPPLVVWAFLLVVALGLLAASVGTVAVVQPQRLMWAAGLR